MNPYGPLTRRAAARAGAALARRAWFPVALAAVAASVRSAPAATTTPAAPSPGLRLAVRPAAGDPTLVTITLSGPGSAALRPLLQDPAAAARLEEVFYFAIRPETPDRPLVAMLAAAAWTDPAGPAVLRPRLSLTRGQTYLAVFEGPRLAAGLPRLTREYTPPVDRRPSDARVTGVFPSLPELPANLLKFYVHFSRPMSEGHVFRFVRLLDGNGRPIAQAFNERELWADEHRRLTLWINPGRTKRSLGLSEALGPVLEPERRYTLELRPGLPDVRGRALARGFRVPFRTRGYDRSQPHLAGWRLAPPAPGSRAPLRVLFPEPLDRALALRVIAVETAAGAALDGRTWLSPDGREWRFAPARSWSAGDYRLAAEGELEDLAGNNLLRPFETTPGAGARPSAAPPRFHRPFRVGKG